MIDETLEELRDAIQKSHGALKRDLARVRTGRANPDILDSVRVEYYGTATPLKQMANISVPEPRLIVIKPFDKSTLQTIEKGIVMAELGVNPSNDGELIRLPIPPLTQERRKELAKKARKLGEDAKVAIRHGRHEAKDMLDQLVKDGDIGEDDGTRAQKEMEEIVKGGTAEVDRIVAAKEDDIMEI